MHGAGFRSKTIDKLPQNSCLSNLRKRQDARGYIVLAPHCCGINWDEWMTPLIHLIDQYRGLPYIYETRIHLTGNSMGGYGTWALSVLRSDWFASAMPLCGGGPSAFAEMLVNLPIHAFHGLLDTTVDPMESMQIAQAVNRAGGHAELILFPEYKHNIWEKIFEDDSNYDWLLSFTNEQEKTQTVSYEGNYYG